MQADHSQIDKRKTTKNQNRSAALGRPAMNILGASTSLRSINPRPWLCFGSSDTWLFVLRGRFLAHKCIILET